MTDDDVSKLLYFCSFQIVKHNEHHYKIKGLHYHIGGWTFPYHIAMRPSMYAYNWVNRFVVNTKVLNDST